MDAEILAAVAAEAPAMTDLLADLVAAPTLLGDEAAGQAVMRRAFADLGLEPFDVPLDRAALEGHPAGAPFGWDVDGKANVLADWDPAGEPAGRSLILNGHIDVVSPEPVSLWTQRPLRRARRGRLDVRARRGRHEVGARGDGRRGARAQAARARAAREGAAAVGGGGGVHGQRRARLRTGRPHRRRGDPHRADAAARSGTPRSASCGSRSACSARPPTRGTRRGRQRDRGLLRRDRSAARARGRAQRHAAAAVRGATRARSTSTSG